MDKLTDSELEGYNNYINGKYNIISNSNIDFNDFNKIPIIEFNDNIYEVKLKDCKKNIITQHYENTNFYEKKIGYFLYSFIMNFYKHNLHNLIGGILRNLFDPQNISDTKYIDIDMIGINYIMLNLIDIIKNYDYSIGIYDKYNYDLKLRILHKYIFGTDIKINVFGIYKTINSNYNVTITYTVLNYYTVKLDINDITKNKDFSYMLRHNRYSVKYPFINLKNSDFLQNELQLYKKYNRLILYNPNIKNSQLDNIPNSLIIKKMCNYKIKSQYLIEKIIEYLGESKLYNYKLYYSIVKKIMIFSHKMCTDEWNTNSSFNYYKIIERYLKFTYRNYKMLPSRCNCNKCIYEGLNDYIKSNKIKLVIIPFPEFIKISYLNLYIYNDYYQNKLYYKYQCRDKFFNQHIPSMMYTKNTRQNLNSEISSQGNYTIKKIKDTKINLYENLIKRRKKKSKAEYAKSNKN